MSSGSPAWRWTRARRSGPFHILGYGIDETDEALLAAIQVVRQPWRASFRRFVTSVRSFGGRGSETSRPCVPPGEDASPDLPPGTQEAICLIHRAGGLAFLAHPLAGLDGIARLEEVLSWMQPQGLDGLEAFHKKYSLETREALLEVAERRGLLTIAGSDFHGLHHSDGDDPGVDMPLIHWNRFAEAVGLGINEEQSSPYTDNAPTRGHIGQ